MLSDRQLNAIIRLTEAHQQSRLIEAFLEILCELELVETARYFEIYNGSKDREFDSSNIRNALIRDPVDPGFEAVAVNKNSDYSDAIEKLEIIKVSSNSKQAVRHIIPVTGKLHAVGLLEVTGAKTSRESWEFICALVEMYGNLLSLIGKKERDALTGLLNRLVFEERLHQILNYVKKADRRTDDSSMKLCFAMVDIDKFKKVNDEFGHLYGDEVLVHFSQIMTRSFRYFDLLCRYGGEEFAIVLRGVELDQAIEILERYRQTVANYLFPQVGRKTASIGVVEIQPGDVLTHIIDKADKALYFAKTHGRNQLQAYERLVEAGKLEPHQVAGGDVELF